ncbi:MAG TPA: hypothetical protein H9765_06690, partial [Candidatus Mediterraneibacter intestinigallinarum]|nr:hypothetical protein [Candidatus Mediterraneibacter intestinigallinarum]
PFSVKILLQLQNHNVIFKGIQSTSWHWMPFGTSGDYHSRGSIARKSKGSENETDSTFFFLWNVIR